MRNIRLTLAYDGTDFCGWQRQPNQPTIQAAVEDALARLVGVRVTLWGSGRTDAGVHALRQVANFKTACPIPCENLVKALNDLLPAAIRVMDASEAPAKFHARYDVVAKTYRYRILNVAVGLPFLGRIAWHYPYPLDLGRMAQAARLLEGEHDFTSFAAAEAHAEEADESAAGAAKARAADPKSMRRTIFSSQMLWRLGTGIFIYEVRGNGFLHHMVRNIVGTLVEVGRGKLAPEDVTRILAARDRKLAGPTAPAQGLCLLRVEY